MSNRQYKLSFKNRQIDLYHTNGSNKNDSLTDQGHMKTILLDGKLFELGKKLPRDFDLFSLSNITLVNDGPNSDWYFQSDHEVEL